MGRVIVFLFSFAVLAYLGPFPVDVPALSPLAAIAYVIQMIVCIYLFFNMFRRRQRGR